MTDIFDEATRLEELDRAEAIDRQRALRDQAAELHKKVVEQLGHDVTDCLSCGLEIDAERRQAVPDCTRCAECQRAAEVRNKIKNR